MMNGEGSGASDSRGSSVRHGHQNILVALVGQPNCGKSTVFNMLTGHHQHVANFPGVTVEKKQGHYMAGESRVEVIDLPGTYSLSSYSQEERITRDFILLQRPEVVVAVVDSANLERHLFLVLQLLEMRLPIVLCLNMADVAERRGLEVDADGLQQELGIPVIRAVARQGRGRDELRRAIRAVCENADHRPPIWRLDYGEPLEPALQTLESSLRQRPHLMEDFSARWLAVKLMEEDRAARRIVLHHTHDDAPGSLLQAVDSELERLAADDRRSAARIIASRRYDEARRIARCCIVQRDPCRVTRTDRLDAVLCSRFLGLVAAGLCLYLAFALTFRVAEDWRWIPWAADFTHHDQRRSPAEVFQWLFEEQAGRLVQGMRPGPLRSLLADGVIGGVGGVMSFVPLIFFMFVCLALLEDSGYLARVAFVLDRYLRRFGLPGNSVLPMVMAGGLAGGCAVPGILATRSLRDRRDRLVTMLVAPFMNCGAKLPCYALLIAAFFAAHRGAVLMALVALSWVAALASALLLRRSLIRGPQTPLMLELPAYHLPTLRHVLRSAGQRTWQYMQKAGTVILAINILLWAAMYFPRSEDPRLAGRVAQASALADPEARLRALQELDAEQAQRQLAGSVAGRIGRLLEPVTRLAGFDWRTNIALIGGFGAKEVIVSCLGTANSLAVMDGDGEDETPRTGLAQRLREDPQWTPLGAAALMLFIMLYAPCLPACVAISRESGAWAWGLFAAVYSTLLAFAAAAAAYQVGLLLGF